MASAGTLALTLDAIATDNIVNIDEQAAGFTITGNTGAIGGATVTITVGTEMPLTATSAGADTATWSVSIPEAATYITEPGVTVTVNASLSGYTDAVEVTRELTIDLTAPSSRTYTAPTALQVGAAIAALSPSTDDTDDSHSVDALPSGLAINAATGAITGTPDTAGTGTQTTTVTITDTAGNTSEASIAFPAVAKGDQDLAGFAYTPANVTFNAPVPTLTPPTGAQTTLAYTATPAEVCTVDAISGELTINGVGTCEITATAPANDNFDEAAATFTVTVASAGTLALTLDAIATDNIVNIDEQAAGFTISGNTGANSGAAVTITVGTETPLTATSAGADTATWSVSILESATYITEPGVTVTVNASLSGYTDAVEVTRELMIDLTAPSSRTYTAPTALQVGAAIAALSPSTDDTDDSHSVDALPSGLGIDAITGAITGTPDTAGTGTQTTKVTITDTAGNTSEATIAFPAVAKGDQDLAGFAYTPANVTFNAPVPTLTPPTGAQTTLAYTATPAEVCTVDAISGELTINGVGTCEITATAPANDNFDEAAATFTVTVASAGTLALTLDAIATDNIVNIDEQAAGFTISGNTGANSGAAVTITVGTETPLTATSAGADTATWSVSILESATYITEPGVTVTVNASLSGYTDAVEVTRELMIDLTAPSSRTYTAPTALQVGAAIAALSPSTDDTDDSHSVDALPSGLGIDAITGAITGTPDTAGTGTQTTTVTITDTAGNTSEATIAFPAVAKGDQDLAGFAYTPANVTFNAPVPTLTPPTGAQTTLAYTATPAEVCTVDPISGALTINGVGACEITATAPANDNFDEAAATFTVTVASAGTLALTLDAIATDNIVNIDEQAAGFTITGNTGAIGGATVTITVGTETPLTATSAGADTATWSVSILESATYITEPGVTVTVNASLSGYSDAVEVTRELMIDLTAPSSRTYTAPTALQVGEAIAALSPSTDDTDDSHSVDALPSGLAINAITGAITGTPDTAGTGTQTTTVTITDTAGNTSEATIAFPAVAKGDQDLAGFAYTPANVTFNAPVPTLTPPTGAQTTLAYTATPAEVCTGDAISGELTINGVGTCEITATAPANDNFDEAAATFTVTVASAGTLALNLDAIATDNIVNIDEQAAGFTITGNTGAIGGATVTITVGTQMPLTATSAGADTATWSVSIPEAATYITEPGVTVTVNASLSGYSDAVEVTRELMIDLTAPSSRTYTAPTALQVGEAIAALSPTSDDTDDSHSVDALPSGLAIDAITGAITGTPDTAATGTQTTRVTITDTAGNTSEASIAFPAVAKGDQDLAGFAYTPANVTVNAPVPTLTPPTGAQTTLGYTTTSTGVCTVDPISGALTINGVGACEITATAPANDNFDEAAATFTVTVASAGTLALTLDAIASDNIVNIAEQAAGFTISGNTGAIGGATVTITVGTETPLTATSAGADTATWSVSILESATYITEPGVTVTVNASLSGYTDAVEVTRELMIDLTAPSSRTYTAPTALQVGEAIAALSPSTDDTDDSHSVDALPSGLGIDAITGAITGTPDAASTGTQTTRVTITDLAGNTAESSITFPVVTKGVQVLNGFEYNPANVTFGSTAPALTVPTGAETTLAYTATPASVCSVDGESGALTINGAGTCAITATAPANDHYQAGTATVTVTVSEAGALALNLDAIATDNIVNIAEQAAGFTITGNTGSIGGASVTVTIGATELNATSADTNPTTWSVSVPADASYISEPDIIVSVNAGRTGYTDAATVTRTLRVDLTQPNTRSWTAPAALQVGVAMNALSPSSDDSDDTYGIDALPSGLTIDSGTGTITGTPDAANTSTYITRVTISDSAGNTDEASITFPAVARGDQPLAGFEYIPASVALDATAPTLTAPTGAQTTLAYTATPTEVCTVDAISGELTINGVGTCEITVTAPANDNFDEGTASFTVTVSSAGTLVLNLDPIATDNIINIAEQAAGFTITGNTGAIGGAAITVTVGEEILTTISADTGPAIWSIDIPADATFISEPDVSISVNADKTGHDDAIEVTRSLSVDLTPPSTRSYTAPATLRVGEPITALSPSSDDGDDTYAIDALPPGLRIDPATGTISGTPATANASTRTVTVTITDNAGNSLQTSISFPAVDPPRAVIVDPTSLRVLEGTSDTYEVVLGSEPTDSVTVSISSSDPDMTVLPDSLTFTTDNESAADYWNKTQSVRVSMADDSEVEDDAHVQLTHSPRGGDYDAVAVATVTVTVPGFEDDGNTVQIHIPTSPEPQQAVTVTVPEGTSVPEGVQVTVPASVSGNIMLKTVEEQPEDPPNGFRAGNLVLDIELETATLLPDQTVTICLPKQDFNQSRVYHYDETLALPEWVELPEPAGGSPMGLVCGVTHSLSPFLLGARLDNHLASGAPTILGTAQVDEMLRTSTDGIIDTDGKPGYASGYTYQWLDGSDNSPISGATGRTYTPVAADLGKTLKLRVNYIDKAGNPESITSDATVAVADMATMATGLTATGLDPDTTSWSPSGAIELCWTPDGFSVGDFDPESYQFRFSFFVADAPGLPAGIADELHEWQAAPSQLSDPSDANQVPNSMAACDMDQGTGFTDIRGSLTPNVHYTYQMRARTQSDGEYVLSDRVSATSVDVATPLLARISSAPNEILPNTIPQSMGSFVVSVGFTSAPQHLSYSEPVEGFDMVEDIQLTNATATLEASDDDAYDGYLLRVTPGVWGQPVTLTVKAGAVTAGTKSNNRASRRWTTTASQTGLRAQFDYMPAWHDGSEFSFELRLSDAPVVDPNVSWDQAFRDHIFEVTGGRITTALRVRENAQQPAVWRITIQPDGTDSVGITLPQTTDCAAPGAVCTADGRALSSRLVAEVTNPEGLAARFEDMPASHDGSEFSFELRLSDAPVADGKISLDQAFLDQVFEVTGGQITNAQGLLADGQAVQRVITIEPDSGGRITNIQSLLADEAPQPALWRITAQPDGAGVVGITLPATTDCTAAGALCTADGRALTTPLAATILGPEPDPLTAQFEQMPASHNGSEFSFVLRLSDAPVADGQISLDQAFRDQVFEVTGGRITNAEQELENGEPLSTLWRMTFTPDGAGAVSITLPPTTDCTAPGAVCTADGRALSAGLTAILGGPAALRVADAEVDEGPNAVLAFQVTLDRAETATVTVDYATSDGTATAGSDYTAASGTLTFAPGETAQTANVAVLDDAHDEGQETLTLTLSNAVNAQLADGVATGTIENVDPMPQAWLARFGRAAADHVVQAIEARWQGGRRDSHMTLGAGRLNSLFDAYRGGNAYHGGSDYHGENVYQEDNLPSGLSSGETRNAGRGADGSWARMDGVHGVQGETMGWSMSGSSQFPTENASGNGHFANGEAAGWSGRDGGGRSLSLPSLRDALMGSSFAYSGAANESGGSPGWLGQWSAWGQAASTRFSGSEGQLSLNGEVDTAMLGMDSQWGSWLGGVVLARSQGEGAYRHPEAAGGDVTSSLTSLHPFVRHEFSERISLWGTLGYGVGRLTLTPEDASRIETDITTTMAAFGGRGLLTIRSAGAGSFELALRSDALLTNTVSDSVEGLMGAAGATSRVRLIIEGTGSLPLAMGVLKPTLEAGLRHDGGDAETGAGFELGGGLAWAAGPLSLQVKGRMLVAHEDTEYEEWGLSSSLQYQPGSDGRGLNLKLGSGLGRYAKRRAGAVDARQHDRHDPGYWHGWRAALPVGDGLRAGRCGWRPTVGSVLRHRGRCRTGDLPDGHETHCRRQRQGGA